MNIPKIEIQTTKAILGLRSTRTTMVMEQPKAVQEIQQPRAQMSIETKKPQLSIDTTQARAEIDMKSVFQRSRDFAETGKQELQAGIGRRASEGTELMKIENGGNPISSIAARSGRQPYSALNIKFVPSYGSVKVKFAPGSLDIQANPQAPIISTTPQKPIVEWTPGKVTGDMEQWPSIQIDVKI